MTIDPQNPPWQTPGASGETADVHHTPPARPEFGGQERREREVLATLFQSINDDRAGLAAAILDRIQSDDWSDPALAGVYEAVKALHAEGEYVDGDSVVVKAQELGWTVDRGILDRLTAAEAIRSVKQLEHYVHQIVTTGARTEVQAALGEAAAYLDSHTASGAIDIDEIARVMQDMADTLAAASRRTAGKVGVDTLAEELESVIAGLADTHGREFLGLPTRTLPTLDKYLLGLRGFLLLAAQPGQGKTALGLQLGLDVVAANPEALFVFFSFEMSRSDMYRRLLSMVSGLPWKTVMLGSPGTPKTFNSPDGLVLADEDRTEFSRAAQQLKQLGKRIVIVDRERMDEVDYSGLLAAIQAAKKETGANRTYVLIDNLQTIPFVRPDGSSWANDVERDNYVIGQLLKLQRATGAALLLIAEQNKEGLGQDALKSTRGTARAVYSPDAVLILQRDKLVREEDSETDRTPVLLKIIKGRDGMYRGTIPLLFDYKRTSFEEGSADGTLPPGGTT